VGKLIGLF